MTRTGRFVAAMLLVTSCTRREPRSSESKPEQLKRQRAKVELRCQKLDEAAADDRDILTVAKSSLASLRAGQLDTIWDALHPQAQQPGQKAPFRSALEAMQGRLRRATEPFTVESAYHVEVRGGASHLAQVRCGSGDDARTLLTNAGDEDVAVVVLRTGGTPFGHATTVQLRRHGAAWKLLGLHVGLASVREQDAQAFEAAADRYVAQQRPIEAHLMLAVAGQLLHRGEMLKLDRAQRISDKRDEVAASAAYKAQLGVWELGGARYDVGGFGVAATGGDLSAVVRYVSPGGLIKEVLDQEADALLAYVTMQHPKLVQEFDAIVFEAYDSALDLSQADGKVAAYRTPRLLPGRTKSPTQPRAQPSG